jgi:hypothetical protein
LFAIARANAGYVGNAPWCAVANIGQGTMEWDCQFASVAACQPNVIAGNRGFCALNPYYVPPARPGCTAPEQAPGLYRPILPDCDCPAPADRPPLSAKPLAAGKRQCDNGVAAAP